LALDRALFLLQVRAHAGVQDRLLHILPLIPEWRKRVESCAATGNNPHERSRSAARLCPPIYSIILSGRCLTCIHGCAL
jgi:hypothetical protein